MPQQSVRHVPLIHTRRCRMATFGNGRALTASGSGRRWCGADDTPGKPAASTPGGDRGLGGRYRKRDESGHLRLPHRRRGHDPGRGLGPFTSVRSRRPRNRTVAREKNVSAPATAPCPRSYKSLTIRSITLMETDGWQRSAAMRLGKSSLPSTRQAQRVRATSAPGMACG